PTRSSRRAWLGSSPSRTAALRGRFTEARRDGERRRARSDESTSMPRERASCVGRPERKSQRLLTARRRDPESPRVDATGERVDLYGYTSMALAAAQVQQKRIEAMERELREELAAHGRLGARAVDAAITRDRRCRTSGDVDAARLSLPARTTRG